jgi:uncharacterized protein YukE
MEGNLKITGASEGFDISGINAYISDIKVKLIQNAIDEMKKETTTVKNTVDQVWVGKSANTFKSNFDYDVKIITDALKEACDVLEKSIYHAAHNLKTIDENLVQKRGN